MSFTISIQRLFCTAAFLFSPALADPPALGKVCKVYDGDTLTLCDKTKIRLWGIDAPELDQPGGIQSRNALASMVMERTVAVDECPHKSYNRYVCVVRVLGQPHPVQKGLVIGGWAWDAPRYSKRAFAAEMQSAQRFRNGIWNGEPIPPAAWRAQKKRQAQ